MGGHGGAGKPDCSPHKWAAILRKWAGSAVAAKMAQEGDCDSCAVEGLTFSTTHISQYGLFGFFILVLGLGIGLIVVVGWILYRTFGTVPSAVPYAGARQVRSSNNDGSSSSDQSPPEGTAPLEGHSHLAASSFSTLVIRT